MNIRSVDLDDVYFFFMQTVAGNWFADVVRHAYDDALYTKCGSGSDGVLICAGTLRGDSVYPPGTGLSGR